MRAVFQLVDTGISSLVRHPSITLLTQPNNPFNLSQY